VQVIRHEQHQPAIPDQMLVVEGAAARTAWPTSARAEVILIARRAVMVMKKRAAFRDPLAGLCAAVVSGRAKSTRGG